MSGVVDEHGVQWEHCNGCDRFVRLTNLGYEPPSETFKYGRMLCIKCTNKHSNIESIQPAPDWKPVYG